VRYYRNHLLDGATLFSKLDSNKLQFNVKYEMTFICVKFDADLINISKVTSHSPGFLAYLVYTIVMFTGVGSGGYAGDLTPQLFMWRGY